MKPDTPPENSIRFHFITLGEDPILRSDVVPGDGQTVRQAAEVAGLSPRDGSPWVVFDNLGNLVNDPPAADMIGERLWIGPPPIRAWCLPSEGCPKCYPRIPITNPNARRL
jgi:hypothetical protein